MRGQKDEGIDKRRHEEVGGYLRRSLCTLFGAFGAIFGLILEPIKKRAASSAVDNRPDLVVLRPARLS